MKLSVKNFGPIKEAQDIEIKPLTVFAGPSNTGKTYLATLIYSFFKVMPKESSVYRRYMKNLTKNKDYNKFVLSFYSWVPGYKAEEENLRNDVKSNIQDVLFSTIIKTYKECWKEEMIQCFGGEEKVLLKQGVELELVDSKNEYQLNPIKLNSSWIRVPIDSLLDNYGRKDYSEVFDEYTQEPSYDLQESFPEFIHLMMSKICNDILSPYAGNIYYLPAIRGGIMQSHRGLASAAVKQASMIGLRENPMTPMFNGVLADFLEGLLMVNSQRRRYRRPDKGNGGFSEIERYLEEHVLGGKINVQETDAQYPDFRYSFGGGKNGEISLTQASSMVSELAPLSLFIRHYLGKGDTLIFEEPEAHLHPEGQRAISEVIVMLVKAGVCVIVTTHSDYILEQLGNFVHAGAMPKEKRKNVKLLGKPIKELFLEPDDIALYDFERKKTGTYVKREPYDSESGIIPKGHEKESMALYNETVGLLNEKNGGE